MQPVEKISITLTPDMLQREGDAERLAAIKARIRRSLDDPRRALTAAEMAEDLETMFAQARKGG